METGHREIARSYVLLRERRARIRERLGSSGSSGSDASETGAPSVRGRGDTCGSPWDRSRIVQALIEEGQLDTETAAEIALVVETRVHGSGLRSISSFLLRELVDNELFERGLTARLKRQTSVAIPKYDLEQVLFRGGDANRRLLPGDPTHVASLFGSQILKQYVLEEVYGGAVSDAYSAGQIHIHQLDDALQLLRAALLCDRLALRS